MLNWDRSTPQQMLSHCFCVPYSLSQLPSCKSGLLDVIYVTRQLPTGQHGRLQRGLKCEMLFLGLHRKQKSSSGENKSCDILNSLDVQWMCNQVMLLYFPFPPNSHLIPVKITTLISAHLFFLQFCGMAFWVSKYTTGGERCLCVSLCAFKCVGEGDGDTARKEREGESKKGSVI